MEASPIKALFFDIADVLAFESFTIGIRQYEYLHQIPAGELYAAIHDHSYWKDFSLGKVSEAEYFQSVKNSFPGELDLSELKELILSGFSPDYRLIDFLRTLAGRYLLGIISNHPKEWFDYFFNLGALGEIFRVNAVSGYLGVRKPDKAIFESALKMAGVSPREAIYVDDRLEMTEEAERLGIRIIIYKGVENFKIELKKFNII